MNRRGFLKGAGAIIVAAPAIVRAASLMPVRPYVVELGGGFLVPPEFADAIREQLDRAGFIHRHEVTAIDVNWNVAPPFKPGDRICISGMRDQPMFEGTIERVNGETIEARAARMIRECYKR